MGREWDLHFLFFGLVILQSRNTPSELEQGLHEISIRHGGIVRGLFELNRSLLEFNDAPDNALSVHVI